MGSRVIPQEPVGQMSRTDFRLTYGQIHLRNYYLSFTAEIRNAIKRAYSEYESSTSAFF